MKLKSLKMFIELIEQGSFSVAADRLSVSQPAISMQIKSLEEYFKTKLLVRQGGEISLTPAGRKVYQKSRQIINSWELLHLDVDQIKGSQCGKLVIGSSTIPAAYLIPDLLAAFHKSFPEVEVTVEVGDSTDMINKLKKQEVDLIIVGSKPTEKQFDQIAVAEDPLVLIAPLNSPLAIQKEIKLKDLYNESMIIREAGSGTRQAMFNALRETGFTKHDFHIVASLGSTEAIISGVESGLGVSFVSGLAAEKASKNNRVKQLKLKNLVMERKLYLAYYKNQIEAPLIKKFIKIAQL